MGRSLPWSEAIDKIFRRFGNYVLEFETGMLWYVVGAVPSHVIRRLFYRLCGMKIGKNSAIHMFLRIYNPSGISIGEGTIVGEQVVLDGRAPLRIGNHVDIASRVMVYNSEHDIHSEDFGPIEQAVEIGDYAFIGPQAIILPGVKIGKGAVVGAGAVVTKDVAPNGIVGGVPAKEIGTRRQTDLHYKLGRPRLFQ
jgi:acetyltransferase-like isoleucine patch superfamily enzyme